jgi:tryptophanyl-tRNA synthetase
MCHSFVNILQADLSSTTIAKFVEALDLTKGIFHGLLSNPQLSYSSTNTGRIFFPSVQCAAAFATSYPELWSEVPSATRLKDIAKMQCLIPMAIDQDPYFRLLRENCHRMSCPSPKPALIHSRFLTALQGVGGKMSSSDPNSAIFMSDTPAQIKASMIFTV